jgi:hypothetical protein
MVIRALSHRLLCVIYALNLCYFLIKCHDYVTADADLFKMVSQFTGAALLPSLGVSLLTAGFVFPINCLNHMHKLCEF